MHRIIVPAVFSFLLAIPSIAKEKPGILFLLAEREYKTAETLPAFFERELKPLGFEAHFLKVSPDEPGRNDMKGLKEALKKTNLLFLSVRRRAPKTAQMQALRAYVKAGKPVMGIRTSSHPFHLRGKPAPKGHALWESFDPEILGGNYNGHHGGKFKTSFSIEPTAKGHAILDGLPSTGRIASGGSLYKSAPLAATAEILLHGFAEGIDESQPVAWTNKPASGNRVFYTSLGQKDDFGQPHFNKLLVNAVHWALKLPVPEKKQKKATEVKEARLPRLVTPDDLDIELILREPDVGNPLYLNFDERGRLWVVEYRQYPWPAGLRLVSHDKVYRNVYDPPFAPPPPHEPGSPFRGKDRISIHEDTNGDGTFDSHKTFLDGLNMTTAALKGRGGVYVLNPPYLLFYADGNNDDQPDSPVPRVLLSGFGLEDSHSMANSLRWGPDGWIYATHGSTVTAYVRRHGMDNQPIPGEDPVHRMGQFAWRYHPETHQYEVFAEGGGNAFGVEIDSLGRVYSGHNGGNTRGFHYVQGGYYRKTFGKHGNLSNPFAFSHFPSMAHPSVKRFTHTFEIYEDTALPSRYHGKLFGVSPNLHYIVASNIQPHGSTFRTEDIDLPVRIGDDPLDKWFAPVDIQTGPDGNLYIADFHARQVAHYIAYSKGLTDPMLGRVYRLKGKHVTGDNSKHVTKDAFKDANLVETTLRHPSRWHRETALRILGDRKSPVHNEQFKKALLNETDQPALQALWALNLCGGFGKEVALQALQNKNAHVRRWTIRLLGDQHRVSPDVAAAMARAAAKETDTETRAQLASTAGRLPAKDAQPILAHLIQRKEDAADPHIPQLVWWAFEANANDHQALLNFFRDRRNWNSQLRTDDALPQENLMRRWALSGGQAELEACAALLGLAPDAENTNRLLKGFQKAFEGRALPPLPAKLTDALSRAQG
ncbi:MAG: dehydrogenase, partial [Opitutae bacterium]|nr:dehydrogenase [Opitutae bacterium]